MTDRELMQMALYALEWKWLEGDTGTNMEVKKYLRDRLAQPEPEPVSQCSYPKCQAANGCVGACSNTALPNRKWVGLTDEEVGGLTMFDGLTHIEVPILADYIRVIEARLKGKNT
jgi:hypothetical protein